MQTDRPSAKKEGRERERERERKRERKRERERERERKRRRERKRERERERETEREGERGQAANNLPAHWAPSFATIWALKGASGCSSRQNLQVAASPQTKV